jgi:hypothetical protein
VSLEKQLIVKTRAENGLVERKAAKEKVDECLERRRGDCFGRCECELCFEGNDQTMTIMSLTLGTTRSPQHECQILVVEIALVGRGVQILFRTECKNRRYRRQRFLPGCDIVRLGRCDAVMIGNSWTGEIVHLAIENNSSRGTHNTRPEVAVNGS